MNAVRLLSAWPLLVIVSAAVALFTVASSAAEEPEVVLAGIEVTPTAPGPEVLCRLVATVQNDGERSVYSFGFDVEVNGRPLRVYESQLFLQVIEAGTSDEVLLYNFWTSETGRPPAPGGRLEVVVRLREARWVEVSEVEENGETIEVWTPVGEVKGLPSTVSQTLQLQ